MTTDPTSSEVEQRARAEAIADAVADAIASVAIAYSHATLADMSTFNPKHFVYDRMEGGNPFDRDPVEWLGEFDSKAEANEFASKLRRERAIIAALRTGSGVADGYAVVPVEPTEAMREAACNIGNHLDWQEIPKLWGDMLAAAKEPDK